MRSWLVAQNELPIKNRSNIFRIDPHAAFATPDEDENRDSTCHGMSLH
jgi:hypothetical protein